ncbi:SEC-C metal-binding domain-containing protein [Cohnella kolymensis]|uniref:SEC-C metal-binding domain-containing protein n=1 Tax=Cohnella kolymensis TaxID=1590652 RepID=UPI000698744A|nr:SEC-C metal-binding domain-containing protein [Cohnella kolymensis]
MQKLGRNDPCHCGSGNKYKRCCLQKDEASHVTRIISKPDPSHISIPRLINEELVWGNELYRLIAVHLFNNTEGLYPPVEIDLAIRLWNDYSSSETPVTKKAGVFPAALEYCLCLIYGHEVTQSQLAEKYNVSVATISQRTHDIMDFADCTLPHLDNALDPLSDHAHPVSRLGMEQAMQQIGSLLEDQNFDSIDEMNNFLNNQLRGQAQKPLPKKPPSKKSQAEELLYSAWDEPNPKKRVEMANAALQLYTDSADAYNILAENAATNLKETAFYYKQGMLAGERDLGEACFKENRGHFWGYVPTRPYMRAKKGYAETCSLMENNSEAIKHYVELLELNPNDNQGVRELLLIAYLELEEWKKGAALIKQYDEDATASFNYNRLLIEYGLHGLSDKLDSYLKKAAKQNPFVLKYLLGMKKIPRQMPEYIGYGDDREAVVYAKTHYHIWQSKPEMMRWLASRRSI